MEKGYDIQLPPTLQMYYMTQKFKTLFEVLNLPEKRADVEKSPPIPYLTTNCC